jgi:hypothetical protein
LAEPSKPQKINNVLLTIDLTESVLEEAIAMKANMIVGVLLYNSDILRSVIILQYLLP